MLKRLHLQNFTVFADAEFEFGPGLNVLVGANGTGKTHVLKAGYVMMFVLEIEMLDSEVKLDRSSGLFVLEPSENKLKAVFQPVPFSAKKLIRRDEIAAENAVATIETVVAHPSGIMSGKFDYCRHHARRLRRELRPYLARATYAARWAQALPALLAGLPPADPAAPPAADTGAGQAAFRQWYARRWLETRPTVLPAQELAEYHLLRLRLLALETEAAGLTMLLS